MRAASPRSEIRRRRRAPPRGRVERPLHDRGGNHATLPYQLAVEIDVRPQRRAERTVRRVDERECQVALAGGRPGCRGDTTHLPAARARGIEQRVVRGLLPGDIESYELAAGPTRFLGEQRAPAGEVPFAEVDEPREPELER